MLKSKFQETCSVIEFSYKKVKNGKNPGIYNSSLKPWFLIRKECYGHFNTVFGGGKGASRPNVFVLRESHFRHTREGMFLILLLLL